MSSMSQSPKKSLVNENAANPKTVSDKVEPTTNAGKFICGCNPHIVCIPDDFGDLIAVVNPPRDALKGEICGQPTKTNAGYYDFKKKDYDVKVDTGDKSNQLQRKCSPCSPCPTWPQKGIPQTPNNSKGVVGGDGGTVPEIPPLPPGEDETPPCEDLTVCEPCKDILKSLIKEYAKKREYEFVEDEEGNITILPDTSGKYEEKYKENLYADAKLDPMYIDCFNELCGYTYEEPNTPPCPECENKTIDELKELAKEVVDAIRDEIGSDSVSVKDLKDNPNVPPILGEILCAMNIGNAGEVNLGDKNDLGIIDELEEPELLEICSDMICKTYTRVCEKCLRDEWFDIRDDLTLIKQEGEDNRNGELIKHPLHFFVKNPTNKVLKEIDECIATCQDDKRITTPPCRKCLEFYDFSTGTVRQPHYNLCEQIYCGEDPTVAGPCEYCENFLIYIIKIKGDCCTYPRVLKDTFLDQIINMPIDEKDKVLRGYSNWDGLSNYDKQFTGYLEVETFKKLTPKDVQSSTFYLDWIVLKKKHISVKVIRTTIDGIKIEEEVFLYDKCYQEFCESPNDCTDCEDLKDTEEGNKLIEITDKCSSGTNRKNYVTKYQDCITNNCFTERTQPKPKLPEQENLNKLCPECMQYTDKYGKKLNTFTEVIKDDGTSIFELSYDVCAREKCSSIGVPGENTSVTLPCLPCLELLNEDGTKNSDKVVWVDVLVNGEVCDKKPIIAFDSCVVQHCPSLTQNEELSCGDCNEYLDENGNNLPLHVLRQKNLMYDSFQECNDFCLRKSRAYKEYTPCKECIDYWNINENRAKTWIELQDLENIEFKSYIECDNTLCKNIISNPPIDVPCVECIDYWDIENDKPLSFNRILSLENKEFNSYKECSQSRCADKFPCKDCYDYWDFDTGIALSIEEIAKKRLPYNTYLECYNKSCLTSRLSTTMALGCEECADYWNQLENRPYTSIELQGKELIYGSYESCYSDLCEDYINRPKLDIKKEFCSACLDYIDLDKSEPLSKEDIQLRNLKYGSYKECERLVCYAGFDCIECKEYWNFEANKPYELYELEKLGLTEFENFSDCAIKRCYEERIPCMDDVAKEFGYNSPEFFEHYSNTYEICTECYDTAVNFGYDSEEYKNCLRNNCFSKECFATGEDFGFDSVEFKRCYLINYILKGNPLCADCACEYDIHTQTQEYIKCVTERCDGAKRLVDPCLEKELQQTISLESYYNEPTPGEIQPPLTICNLTFDETLLEELRSSNGVNTIKLNKSVIINDIPYLEDKFELSDGSILKRRKRVFSREDIIDYLGNELLDLTPEQQNVLIEKTKQELLRIKFTIENKDIELDTYDTGVITNCGYEGDCFNFFETTYEEYPDNRDYYKLILTSKLDGKTQEMIIYNEYEGPDDFTDEDLIPPEYNICDEAIEGLINSDKKLRELLIEKNIIDELTEVVAQESLDYVKYKLILGNKDFIEIIDFLCSNDIAPNQDLFREVTERETSLDFIKVDDIEVMTSEKMREETRIKSIEFAEKVKQPKAVTINDVNTPPEITVISSSKGNVDIVIPKVITRVAINRTEEELSSIRDYLDRLEELHQFKSESFLKSLKLSIKIPKTKIVGIPIDSDDFTENVLLKTTLFKEVFIDSKSFKDFLAKYNMDFLFEVKIESEEFAEDNFGNVVEDISIEIDSEKVKEFKEKIMRDEDNEYRIESKTFIDSIINLNNLIITEKYIDTFIYTKKENGISKIVVEIKQL
jgi:hypothetical protein